MEVFCPDAGVNAGHHQQFRCNEPGNDQRCRKGDVNFPGQWLDDNGEQQQAGQDQDGMFSCCYHVSCLQAVAAVWSGAAMSGCSSLRGTDKPLLPTTRAWKRCSSRGSLTPQECAMMPTS